MSYLEEPGPDHPTYDPSPYRTSDAPISEPEYMLKSEGMLRVQGVHRAAYYILCAAVIITQCTLAWVAHTGFQRINAMPERVTVRTEVVERVEKVQVNTDEGLCHDTFVTTGTCPHHNQRLTIETVYHPIGNGHVYKCSCVR